MLTTLRLCRHSHKEGKYHREADLNRRRLDKKPSHVHQHIVARLVAFPASAEWPLSYDLRGAKKEADLEARHPWRATLGLAQDRDSDVAASLRTLDRTVQRGAV